MAQRRMFSKQIVHTDAFMDMSPTAQNLYFHLSMEADDDGFVSNPNRIMKLLGSNADDYKILIVKRFVLQFKSGICVIKHWMIHNYIQKDRYLPTTHTKEKNLLEIEENRAYTECIQDVPSLDTQVRLGEDRIGKARLGQSKDIYGEFKNVKLSLEEYEKLIKTFTEKNTLILIEELSGYIASKRKNYASHYATLLNWGRRKIQDYKTKTQNKGFASINDK